MQLINIESLMEQSGVKFGTSGIRGLVSEMSDELVIAYTLAFAKALNIKAGTEVGIATDLRPSSPQIAKAIYSALKAVGIKARFFGEIPTPALAYYAEQQKMPAIMVTGSHIPYDRNGIKFYSDAGEITKEHETAIATSKIEVDNVEIIDLPRVETTAYDAYVARYIDFFPGGMFKGKRVGFYQHSSVARDILTELLGELGADVVALERTNDFVPIDTEAVSEEDVLKAKEWAKSNNFDLLISTDGDADRPLIGDESGEWLRGDIVGLLTSQFLNIDAIATPVSCNTAIELSGEFKQVVRTRIGSPYVISALNDLLATGQSVAGFEANGGYMLASEITLNGNTLLPLCTRDAVLPILAVMALASKAEKPVSQIAQDLPYRYTASNRIKDFSTEKSRALIELFERDRSRINQLFEGEGLTFKAVDTTDGLRVTMQNGDIVHYRPSGNAPELRCYAESENSDRSSYLVEMALSKIQTVAI